MAGLTWLDAAVLGLLLFTALRGFHRGLLRQVFDLAGTAVGILVAYTSFRDAGRLLTQWTGLPPVIAEVLGFLLLVVGISLTGSVLGHLMSRAVRVTSLSFFDGLGGVGVGLLKGFLIAAIVLVVMSSVPSEALAGALERSEVARWILVAVPGMYEVVSPWLPPELPDLPWGPPGGASDVGEGSGPYVSMEVGMASARTVPSQV